MTDYKKLVATVTRVRDRIGVDDYHDVANYNKVMDGLTEVIAELTRLAGCDALDVGRVYFVTHKGRLQDYPYMWLGYAWACPDGEGGTTHFPARTFEPYIGEDGLPVVTKVPGKA